MDIATPPPVIQRTQAIPDRVLRCMAPLRIAAIKPSIRPRPGVR